MARRRWSPSLILRRVVRVLVGLGVLVVLLGLDAWSADSATAAPAQPQPEVGDCIRIERRTLEMPDQIDPPAHPSDRGEVLADGESPIDDRYVVRYCYQAVAEGEWDTTHAWIKDADAFPYQYEQRYPYVEEDMCVVVHTGEAADGAAIDVGLDQLDLINADVIDGRQIDQLGYITSADTEPPLATTGQVPLGEAELHAPNEEVYCRHPDNRWHRTSAAVDFRNAWYGAWPECRTIDVTRGDFAEGPPRWVPNRGADLARVGPVVFEGVGDVRQVDDSFDPRYRDPESLRSYCRNDGRWYIVEAHVTEQVVPGREWNLLVNPTLGACVAIKMPGLGKVWEVLPWPNRVDRLIDVYKDNGHHVVAGMGQADEVLLLEDWERVHSGQEPTEVYCWMGEYWRRGDSAVNLPCAERSLSERDEEACFGTYPSRVYDLGYDEEKAEEGGLVATYRGFLMSFLFDIAKWVIGLALQITGWALRLNIRDYDQFAIRLGDNFETNLLGGEIGAKFGLEQLVWLVLFGWVGFSILVGKLALAGGELLTSVVLVILAGVLMANREGYMEGLWHVMDEASNDLMLAGQGRDPTDGDQNMDSVIRGAQQQIHVVFVEQPYYALAWNDFRDDDAAACKRFVDSKLLPQGPLGVEQTPRDELRRLLESDGVDCGNSADFNADPSYERLFSTLLVCATAVAVAFLLLAVGLTLIVAKLVAALLFGLLPFVLLIVVLPAGGRRMGWMWVTTEGQMVLAVLGMSLVLSAFLTGLTELSNAAAASGAPLVNRFVLLFLAVMVAAAIRRRLLQGGERTAGRFTDNLTNTRVGGGGAPWVGPSGSSGVALAATDAGIRHATVAAAWVAGGATAAGGRVVAQRLRERRAWHNIVKARRKGDKQAKVGAFAPPPPLPDPGGSGGGGGGGGGPSGGGSPPPNPNPPPNPSPNQPRPRQGGPRPQPRPRPNGGQPQPQPRSHGPRPEPLRPDGRQPMPPPRPRTHGGTPRQRPRPGRDGPARPQPRRLDERPQPRQWPEDPPREPRLPR